MIIIGLRLVINVSSTNFISLYVVEKHVVEEALNVEEVGGRRESQRATPKRAVRICLRSELAKKGCHTDSFRE